MLNKPQFIEVSTETKMRLVLEAARRNVSVEALARQLLETIAEDKLFKAVLEE